MLNLFQNIQRFVQTLGTFFYQSYQDAETVRDWIKSISWVGQSTLRHGVDTASTYNRFLIPPTHIVSVKKFSLSKDDYVNGTFMVPLYGDTDLTYGMNGLTYGGLLRRTFDNGVADDDTLYVEDQIVGVAYITDKPVNPDRCWVSGLDYSIKSQKIKFYDQILKRHFEDNDDDFVCFVHFAARDKKYIQDRLGFLSKISGESTQAYKDACNTFINCVISGTSKLNLRRLLGYIFGCGVVSKDSPVHQWYKKSEDIYAVVLNEEAHVGEPTLPVAASYEMGDFLSAYIKPITNEPLIVPLRLLGRGFTHGLMFKDEDVILEQDPVTKKYTFPVYGQTEDIALFWERLYETVTPAELFAQTNGGHFNPARFIKEGVYPKWEHYIVDGTLVKSTELWQNLSILKNIVPVGVVLQIEVHMAPCYIDVNGDVDLPGGGREDLAMVDVEAEVEIYSAPSQICVSKEACK